MSNHTQIEILFFLNIYSDSLYKKSLIKMLDKIIFVFKMTILVKARMQSG
jgi:hypothetical protein